MARKPTGSIRSTATGFDTCTTSVAPVAIGPANAELMTGVPWRYLRNRYPGLLKTIGERKQVILARDLERELAGRNVRDEASGGVEELAAELGIELERE